MITIASILTQFAIYGALAIALGVAIAVIFAVVRNVRREAAKQGVVISDGVNLQEVQIITQLIKKELEENKELEALKNLKRIIEKAAAEKNL